MSDQLKFTKDHEWVSSIQGSIARVGITSYAVESLHGIVFVSLPTVGQQVSQGEVVAEVESTKAVSEVFSPLDGVVVTVNNDAATNPDLVNDDPWQAGWLFEIDMSDTAQIDTLLDRQAYDEHLK
ncbi:MAG: glycine cleavage system protein GcvH [Propionibacteriaceae bacterium]|jgi:glycine cleavage system H protein|nr:glycine cleavage system protein GcvH [Propionibacteriaceae bacterium]